MVFVVFVVLLYSTKILNKELIALLQPDGGYNLDWQEVEGKIDRNQILLQEEIYKQFNDGLLMVADWPQVNFSLSKEDREAFEGLQNIVTAVRNIRAMYNIFPKQDVDALVVGPESLETSREVILRLANVGNLNIDAKAKKPDQSASAVIGSVQVYVPLEGIVDLSAERVRIEKELESASGYVVNLEKRLANTDYVNNAPAEVVYSTKAELEKSKERVRMLESEINSLT